MSDACPRGPTLLRGSCTKNPDRQIILDLRSPLSRYGKFPGGYVWRGNDSGTHVLTT